jgi:hypothetical protein
MELSNNQLILERDFGYYLIFDAGAAHQQFVFIDNCTINFYLINQNIGRGHGKTFYFDIFHRFLYKILSVGKNGGILLAES